jgi:putative transposase
MGRFAVDSLEEACDRLFTFTWLPRSQWKSARTTNAIERLHEEFKRRVKTQTVPPSAETAAMLFWALLGRSDHDAQSRRMGDSHPKAR